MGADDKEVSRAAIRKVKTFLLLSRALQTEVDLNVGRGKLAWTTVMIEWVEMFLVVVVIVNLLMSTALVVFFLAPVITKKGTWKS